MSTSTAHLYPTINSVLSSAERLTVLYSPFRPRSLNPASYDGKMKFWVLAIEEFTTCDPKVAFNVKDLQAAFQTEDGRKAAGLLDVINFLLGDGRCMTVEDFWKWMNTKYGPGILGWISWSMVPLKWGLWKLWSFSPLGNGCSIDSDTRVVFLPQLRRQESAALKLDHLTSRVLSSDQWKAEISHELGLDGEDTDILYAYMKHTGNLITDSLGHKTIVKMKGVGVVHGSASETITQAEKSVYDITATINGLEKDLHKLIDKQGELEKLAREALREKKRAVAKHHLRNKQLCEKRALKINDVLDNLTVVQLQIEDAATDAKIIAAYEAGKKALDNQLKSNNLTTDRVTEVMLDLQEALEEQTEISQSISQPMEPGDAMELEDELAALLATSTEIPTSSDMDDDEKMDTSLPLEDQFPSVAGLPNLDGNESQKSYTAEVSQ